jgi:hypothetical protein
MVRILVSIGVFASLASAQNRGVINPQQVPAPMMYHHVWAVTPLVGTGKPGDAVRPMFVPAPPMPAKASTVVLPPAGALAPGDRSGVLGYQMQLSDDGKSALVEYVFASPVTFQVVLLAEAAVRGIPVPTGPISNGPAPLHPGLAAPSVAQAALEAEVPGLKIFERGKANESDILTEFTKHKAAYTLNSGGVRPQ